jgi:hypothetical protein
MKMLNVSERTVTRWKLKLKDQQESGSSHPIFDDLLEIKSEPEENIEDYGE